MKTTWLGRTRITVKKLIGLCTFISSINLIAGNLGGQEENVLLRNQKLLPPPKITISVQRKTLSNCDSERDEFEDGGESSSCYETIETDFSTSIDSAVLGTDNDRLIFRCSAPYVTRWIATMLPIKGTSYMESRRENQSPFDVTNATFVSEFRLVVGTGNSGWVKCQSAINPTKNQTSGMYIFSQSGEDLVGDEENELRPHLMGPLEIKCCANRPDVNPTLEEEVDDDYVEIDPERILQQYDPRYGFVVLGSDKPDQSYRCVTDEHEFLHHFKTIKPITQVSIDGNTTNLVESLTLDTNYFVTEQGGTTNERLPDISCASDRSYTIILKMIRCRSAFHCDWLSVCLEKCLFKYNSETLERRSTGTSVTLTNPYFTGMTSCRIWLGSKTAIKYYFIGLDRHSYFTDDKNIPKNALIRVNTEERNFYADYSTSFLCEISTFVLIPNIKFAVVFKNGTTTLLEDKDNPFHNNSNSTRYKSTLLIEYETRGFAQRTLHLNLTKEMNELMCLAPWYNSSEWIHVTTSFRPREVILPLIDKSAEKETRILHEGHKDQLLRCAAKGDPKPSLTWDFPNPQLREIIKLSESNEGESILTFPNVENMNIFTGIYKCVAFSRFGNDTSNFDVKVEDLRLGAGSIAGICFASFGFLSVVAGIIFFGYKYHFAKRYIRDLTEEEIHEFTHGNEEDREAQKVEPTSPEGAQTRGFSLSYVLAEEDLVIAKDFILGHGEYGMVYRGILHGEAVAVKTTKPNADISYFKALLLELKTMAYIGEHSNVVAFKGAVTNRIRERVIYAVLELSPLGNLNSYLRKIGPRFFNLLPNADGKIATYENINEAPVTQTNMISWCEQIANGMAYLTEKKVCHGDLATRNVLVFKNDVVKITDFGLSKQLYNYTNYIKKKVVPLPWRWLAIETLRYMEFSSKSDVWAFGVTMWEIFSLSQVPYPTESYTLEFVEKLQKGHRLKQPVYAPEIIYDFMKKCWNEHPDSRPKFIHLAEDLLAVLKDDEVFKTDSVPVPGVHTKKLNIYTTTSPLAGHSSQKKNEPQSNPGTSSGQNSDLNPGPSPKQNPEPNPGPSPKQNPESNPGPSPKNTSEPLQQPPDPRKPLPKPRKFKTAVKRMTYINLRKY